MLLNCEPSGVELLKNLVLPGIGHICIVDDQKICEKDLGNNFFVDDDHLNQNRAEVLLIINIFLFSYVKHYLGNLQISIRNEQ